MIPSDNNSLSAIALNNSISSYVLVEYNRKNDIINEIERSADNFCLGLDLLALSSIGINCVANQLNLTINIKRYIFT